MSNETEISNEEVKRKMYNMQMAYGAGHNPETKEERQARELEYQRERAYSNAYDALDAYSSGEHEMTIEKIVTLARVEATKRKRKGEAIKAVEQVLKAEGLECLFSVGPINQCGNYSPLFNYHIYERALELFKSIVIKQDDIDGPVSLFKTIAGQCVNAVESFDEVARVLCSEKKE